MSERGENGQEWEWTFKQAGITKQIAEDEIICMACGAVNEWEDDSHACMGGGTESITVCKNCGSREWSHTFGGGYEVRENGKVIEKGTW